ncbi:MAG TPA: hypothetical protein VIY51_15765 [Xanthobacteraceae bacterium]
MTPDELSQNTKKALAKLTEQRGKLIELLATSYAEAYVDELLKVQAAIDLLRREAT